MIELIFFYGSEVILVRITGKKVEFGNSSYGNKLAIIDGLGLDKAGTLKEHPDLIDNPNWKNIAISRLKEHIEKLESEEKIADYVIKELSKKGYIPKYKQIKGFRPIPIKL